MTIRLSSRHRFLALAILFEGGLGVAAGVAGYLTGNPPLATVRQGGASARETLMALAVGITAAVPMVAGLLLVDRCPIEPLRQLREFVDAYVVPLFVSFSAIQLLLLSLAAGVGEEMLFRGLMQAGVARWLGPPLGTILGLVLASFAFGICHWLTATYAVLATAVGLYLGCLFLVTDNLLAPIAAHATYDFLALMYLVRGWRDRQPAVVGTPQE